MFLNDGVSEPINCLKNVLAFDSCFDMDLVGCATSAGLAKRIIS